jgi:FAD/FMN-containing dehydrogenase
MELVEKHLGLSNPISNAPFYVLVEISGSHEAHDREKLDGFLERVMEEGCVCDGTVAQDWSKIRAVWALRERIAEALNAEGAVYKVTY